MKNPFNLFRRASLALVVGGISLSLASPAHAALDEVLSDKAADVSIQKIGEHSLRVRSVGKLKEFADESGKVFAARWTGRVDMVSLLGTHFASYADALNARRVKNHHVVRIATPELTVDAVSYGRFFRGTVVLTKQLPKGVTYDALR